MNKKKFIICLCTIMVAIFSIIYLQSCNKQLVDFTYSFDRAIIMHANGEEQIIKISSWKDYSDGEQLQIVDTDGKVWLVNSVYTILVKD